MTKGHLSLLCGVINIPGTINSNGDSLDPPGRWCVVQRMPNGLRGGNSFPPSPEIPSQVKYCGGRERNTVGTALAEGMGRTFSLVEDCLEMRPGAAKV